MKNFFYTLMLLFCQYFVVLGQDNGCMFPLSFEGKSNCTEVQTEKNGSEVWLKFTAPAALNHISIKNLSLNQYPEEYWMNLGKMDYALYAKDRMLAMPQSSTFTRTDNDTYTISNLGLQAGQTYYLALFFPEDIAIDYSVCLHTQAEPFFLYSKFNQSTSPKTKDLFSFKVYNPSAKQKVFYNIKVYRWDAINTLLLEGKSKALFLNRGSNEYASELRVKDFNFECCDPYPDYLDDESWSFGKGKYKVIMQLVDEYNKPLAKSTEVYFSDPPKKEKSFGVTDASKLEIKTIPTGRSSGHIGDMSIYNPTNQTATLIVGPYVIPSEKDLQGYILPEECIYSLKPQKTFNYKIQGYCMNAERPAIALNGTFPPLSSWLSEEDFEMRWLRELAQNRKTSFLNKNKNYNGIALKLPFSDKFFPYAINVDEHLPEAAPVLLATLKNIIKVYDDLEERKKFKSPLDAYPTKEREAVIQHVFWKYATSMQSINYNVDVFENMLKAQEVTKDWYNSNKSKRASFNKDINAWWSLFNEVGEAANCWTFEGKDKEYDFSGRSLDIWQKIEMTGPNAKIEPPKSKAPYWIVGGVVAATAGVLLWQNLKVDCSDRNYTLSVSSDQPLCEVENAATILTVQTDCPDCDFIWSNNDRDSITTIDEPGIYNISIADKDGCGTNQDIMVDLVERPSMIIQGNTAFCEGKSTMLSFNTNCLDCPFEWNVGDATYITETIIASESGFYEATLMKDGCEFEETAQVTMIQDLSLEIEGDLMFCGGEEGELRAITDCENCTYRWTYKGNQDEFISTEPNITIDKGGTYYLTITNPEECIALSEVFVNVTDIADVTFEGDPFICGNKSATIIVSADLDNSTFVWNNGVQDSMLVVSEEGVYTVTITSEDGCISKDSLFIEQLAPLEVEITGNPEICEGGFTILNAVTNCNICNYEWTNGELNQSAAIEDIGEDVCVTVTDIQTGCSASTCITTILGEPFETEISGDEIFCQGDPITLSVQPQNNYLNYVWFSENGTIQEDTFSINVTESGLYGINIETVQGCFGEATIEIEQYESIQAIDDFETTTNGETLVLLPLENDLGVEVQLLSADFLAEENGTIEDVLLENGVIVFNTNGMENGDTVQIEYTITGICGQIDTAIYEIILLSGFKPHKNEISISSALKNGNRRINAISNEDLNTNAFISIPHPTGIRFAQNFKVGKRTQLNEAISFHPQWLTPFHTNNFERINQIQFESSVIYTLSQKQNIAFKTGIGIDHLHLPQDSRYQLTQTTYPFGQAAILYNPPKFKKLHLSLYSNLYRPISSNPQVQYGIQFSIK